MTDTPQADREDAAKTAARLLRGDVRELSAMPTLLDAYEIATLADWILTGEWTGEEPAAEPGPATDFEDYQPEANTATTSNVYGVRDPTRVGVPGGDTA